MRKLLLRCLASHSGSDNYCYCNRVITASLALAYVGRLDGPSWNLHSGTAPTLLPGVQALA